MVLPLKWMPAAAYGGLFKAPAAAFVTVHCTESENTPAMAEALAGPNWFGGTKAGTSSHKVVDVDSICEGVKRDRVAYHAGPGGNTWGIAYEFSGRASWTAAKWREPAQLQMLRNAAPHIADDLIAITGSRAKALAAARWLSLAQVAQHANGLCTHNDIRLALGGTTHSDPGPNFPYAELLAYVQAELNPTTEEDDMDPALVSKINDLHVWMTDMKTQGYGRPGELLPAPEYVRDLHQRMDEEKATEAKRAADAAS